MTCNRIPSLYLLLAGMVLFALVLGLHPSIQSAAPPKEVTPREPLEQQLLREGVASLARDVRKGNARRGAKVFYRQHLGCTKCHSTGKGTSPLGPDLAKLDKKTTLTHIIESILEPSKVIKKEFQTVQVVTTKGQIKLGLLARDRRDRIELRDAQTVGTVVKIRKKDIDVLKPSPMSLMPTGLVNQLASRQDFLDLVRYVHEIATQGPSRARKLEPKQIQVPVVADKMDHAKQIAQLQSADWKKGQALYGLYCVSCHGKDGNKIVNPLARRFAKDPLKFGTDPYSMWKTVTYGNGLMFPQAALLSAEERYQVVHYIRERFIKPSNPTQYFRVSKKYLAGVNARARVDARKLGGSIKIVVAPGMIDGTMGKHMNYGPYLSHSIAFSKPKNHNAPRFKDTTERAMVIKVPGGPVVCYDIERYSVSAIWQGSIATTAKSHHTSYKGNICLTPGGTVTYKNVDDAGWAVDNLMSVVGTRELRFKGHYLHGEQVLLRFEVAGRLVEEVPGAVVGKGSTLSRTFRIGAGDKGLYCLVGRFDQGKAKVTGNRAVLKGKDSQLVSTCTGDSDGLTFTGDGKGGLWLNIPAGKKSRTFTLWYTVGQSDELQVPDAKASPDLDVLTRGGPRLWSKLVHVKGVLGKPVEGYAADEITVPYANPWGSWMRTTAFDFFSDGRSAAVSTLSGDVWIVRWSKPDLSDITWSRFATGLYEPLGLRIVKDIVYIRGRDRITRLHDVNSDGEADYYENFHQEGEIGPGYHAFLFDLQTDREGNFYFTRSGRKAPHKGGVVKLSPDGKTSELICTDFRHPNGMGAGGPHDWITVADNPDGKAIFNGVALVRRGHTHGYEKGRTIPMLAVLPARVDSSSGGQCWTDPRRWGPLGGSMIHTSYSRMAAFYILTQNLKPHPNGFAIRLPFDFKSGLMRPRTNPVDGQLYVLGHKGWDTRAPYDGCLYRIRWVGGSTHLISDVLANTRGLRLTFSCDLDPKTIRNSNFTVCREAKKKTTPVRMGDVKLIDKRTVEVALPDIGKEVVAQRSRKDRKTGRVTVDVLDPIRLTTNIRAADGTPIEQTVFATINSLPAQRK